MRLAVVGVGALGGYFGARLRQADGDVRFLARGRHLEALRTRGLRVQSVFGDVALAPEQVPAADDPHQIGPVDVVLFTVKSFDTQEAARLLPPLLRPDTAVISLQNGIDNEEKLGAEIGAEHVVGGAAYIFAGLVEPGVVRHSGGPTRIVFGELDGRRSARLEVFRAACERAGFGAEIVADIRAALWTKYAFICAQAGTTAAVRQPIGVIRETPATWALFRHIVEEAWRVGRAEGVRLPDDLVERQLAPCREARAGELLLPLRRPRRGATDGARRLAWRARSARWTSWRAHAGSGDPLCRASPVGRSKPRVC